MNLANGPLVVIPEPIRSMGWSYDVERSILEPHGIRLLVPDDAAAGGRQPCPTRTSSSPRARLTCRRHRPARRASASGSSATAWDGLRRRRRREGARHPDLELPDLEQRGGLGPRDAADPGRPAPSAAVRAWRRGRRLGRVRVAAPGRDPPAAVADDRDHRARPDRPSRRPEARTASGRRSSPTTRSSSRPATRRSSWSRWTSWRPAPTSSSRARR